MKKENPLAFLFSCARLALSLHQFDFSTPRKRMNSKDDITQNAFSLIADFEGDMDALLHTPHEDTLPVLPLRNLMLFPGDRKSVV